MKLTANKRIYHQKKPFGNCEKNEQEIKEAKEAIVKSFVERFEQMLKDNPDLIQWEYVDDYIDDLTGTVNVSISKPKKKG